MKYASRSIRNITSLFIEVEIIALIGLIGVGLLFPYIHADYLNIEYPDWYVHAFRIDQLRHYGFASWSHVWSNGISLWMSYQFVIHYLTLWVSESLGVGTNRAMILMVLMLFVIYASSIYAAIRVFGMSRIAGIVGALLAFTVSQYYVAIRDYSILLGFSLYPLTLILWKYYSEGKLTYIFPTLAGFYFYVHPILALFSLALYGVSFVLSGRRVFSLATPFQLLLYAGVSSFFWYPTIVHPAVTNSILTNTYFINQILLPREQFGISILLYVLFFLCAFLFVLPIFKRPVWWNILFVLTALWLILVSLAVSGNISGVFLKFQFTRGMVLIGIQMIMLVAYVAHQLVRTCMLTAYSVVCILGVIALVRACWFASIYPPLTRPHVVDQTHEFTRLHERLIGGRVLPYDIGISSFMAADLVYFPISYAAHRDSTVISQRLIQLASYNPHIKPGTEKNVRRLHSYLYLTATPYIIFDSYVPLNSALTKNLSYTREKSIITEHVQFDLLKMPNRVTGAWAVDTETDALLSASGDFGDINDVANQSKLDEYVATLADGLSHDTNLKLDVTYPSPQTIAVSIPEPIENGTVFVSESFDDGWQGSINGQPVNLSSGGPGFIRAALPSAVSGTLTLTHRWQTWFYTCVYIVIASIFAAICMEIVLLVTQSKKRKSHV